MSNNKGGKTKDAGEMLLDIETRIGELAEKEERAKPKPTGYIGTGSLPSGKPPKHERLGMTEKRISQSQAIAKHPEIVEKVKAQARENEDIPTRTAVVNEIRYRLRSTWLPLHVDSVRHFLADFHRSPEGFGFFQFLDDLSLDLRCDLRDAL